MGILRKLAPYVVAAASFLPLGGCPKDCKSTTGPYNPPPLIIQPKQADTQNPIGRSQDNQDPIPIVQEDGDYKTVSTSRKVRTEDGSVFTLNLQVHGPRQVRKRENAIYTATAEKISVGSIAIGAAVPNGDASFLPDGGSFKRMPPNGDYVASGDARYPFDKFAESLPGYQELGEKYRGDLKNISDIGRDRLLSELTPNLPIWFSDKKFTQSDLSLFTRRGSIGFSGAKQEIVCPAERDTQLKVFAFVNPWMSPDNVLLTTEFPIDVIDDVEPTKPKQEPPVSTLVGKDALLEYAKLAISPTNDRVSFSARQMDRLGHYLQGVLGTINLDSKTPTTTTCEGEPKLLSWSPDGRLIHSGYGLIWFAGVENGSDTRVSAKYPTGIAKSLAWSPGNRILYSQDLLAGERRIQRDIFSMDPETGETVNLTNTPDTDERNPIWSPDMQRISFLSSRTVVENNRSRNITEIFLMDKDGSNRRSLTDNQYMKKRLGGWVQDGIWFIETGGDNFWHEVSIISPNTSGGYKQIYSDGEFFREGELVLAPDMIISGQDLQERSFAISQDGRMLVMTASTKPSTPTSGRFDKDLYFVDLQSKKLTRITQGKIIQEMAATPGLDWAVCAVRERDGEELDKFDLTQLADNRSVNTQNRQEIQTQRQTEIRSPTSRTLAKGRYPVWFPDSKRLVIARDDEPGSGSLYALDTESSNVVKLTNLPGYEREPSISPNGRYVAFISENQWLTLLDMETNQVRHITEVPHFDWSSFWIGNDYISAFRLGGDLGFITDINGNMPPEEIKSALSENRTQKALECLLSTRDRTTDPRGWTVAGGSVIYTLTSHRGSIEEGTCSTTDLSSSNLDRDLMYMPRVTDVTDTDEFSEFSPTASPDGSRIAFVKARLYPPYEMVGNERRRQTKPDDYKLCISDPDGSNISVIFDSGKNPITRARWSPDGRHIAIGMEENSKEVIKLLDLSD